MRPGGAISPYVGLVAPLLDQRVAVELLYQHDFIGNETIFYPYGTAETYSHQEDNIFMARLLFVFGTR